MNMHAHTHTHTRDTAASVYVLTPLSLPCLQFASADAMEAFQRYRTDVTNFRSVTCKFRENLMTGVEGGLTEASAAGASAPSSSGAAPVS